MLPAGRAAVDHGHTQWHWLRLKYNRLIAKYNQVVAALNSQERRRKFLEALALLHSSGSCDDEPSSNYDEPSQQRIVVEKAGPPPAPDFPAHHLNIPKASSLYWAPPRYP